MTGAPPTSLKRFPSVTMLLMVTGLVAGGAQRTAEPPRLAVLIVVDQMRADYVDRFGSDWSAGLRRLLQEGARFSNAAFPYLNTFTCPGHATVSTGAFPSTHGVIGNSWYDRSLHRVVTCTEQPDVETVGYGVSIGSGNGPLRLQVPTFGDEMKRQRGARVVSLSLKARSAIMLAGHTGDAVTWLAPGADGFETSTAYTRTPVAEVDAFLKANPIAADFGETWSRLLPDSRYPEPDDGTGEEPPAGWSRSFPHVVGGGDSLTPLDHYRQWQSSPLADAYLGRFAAYLTETMRLGQDDRTDVLAIAFSTPDYVGHSFGPRSQEVRDTYARLDVTLGVLFDRFDALVGRDRYVVALSADHGVAEIPEQELGSAGGRISVADVSALIDQTATAAAGGERYLASLACCGAHTGNDIYLLPGAYGRLKESPGALEAIVQALEKQPGIARVFRREELSHPTGEPSRLERAAAASYKPELSGDLIVALEPGWMFVATGTTHGTASEVDQRVPLFLMGPGVRAGTYGESVTPADVAPTLAAIFGIDMPHADGRVLGRALQ